MPAEMPVALMPQFAQTADKQALWTGFLRRSPPTLPPPSFDELLEADALTIRHADRGNGHDHEEPTVCTTLCWRETDSNLRSPAGVII